MGQTMQGRRVEPDINKYNWGMAPGDYGYAKNDPWEAWVCLSPNGLIGALGNHKVTEHEDGTITVSPSILITVDNPDDGNASYHGFLKRGVWEEC